MNHDVSIVLKNTTIGIPQSSDGIVALIFKGIATANLPLNKMVLLAKLADAVAYGLTAAYDLTNSTAIYQQISEFYEEAGDGTLLWIGIFDKTTVMKTFLASATCSQMIQSTANSDPTQRVKVVGFCFDQIALATSTDLPAEVTEAIPIAQATQQALFANNCRVVFILDGAGMNKSTSPTDLDTVATLASPQVGLCISTATIPVTTELHAAGIGYSVANGLTVTGGTGTGMLVNITSVASGLITGYEIADYGLGYSQDDTIVIVQTDGAGGQLKVDWVNHVSSVGKVLARKAKISVGTSIGRVSDGPIVASGMYLTNGLNVNNLTKTDFDSLGNKQYIFALTLQDYTGFYWNDDATCDLATHALSRVKENCVANKLCDAANAMMVADREANLIVTNKGDLDAGYCAGKQQYFYDTYIASLIASNDISNANLTITGIAYSTTKTVTLTLKIIAATPYGDVEGTVEFVATL